MAEAGNLHRFFARADVRPDFATRQFSQDHAKEETA